MKSYTIKGNMQYLGKVKPTKLPLDEEDKVVTRVIRRLLDLGWSEEEVEAAIVELLKELENNWIGLT